MSAETARVGLELRFGGAKDPMLAAELSLRRRALADPLGLPLSAVRFEYEDTSLHLWALEHGALVGCVLFHRDDEHSGRLYQMAVDEPARGRGIGRALVRRLESRLRELHVREVWLHARAPVVGFYERLGYQPIGEPFEEVGIPHHKLHRSL